jgi:small neutral amino acid transporter SnatA (MarC family)
VSGTAWTFLIGLIFFLFIGIPLEASGIYGLQVFGSIFFLVGLVMMFAAYVQHNDNLKKNRQAQRVAQQLVRLGYPQTPYPQQIIIQAPPSSTHSEITHEREIVKVRCKSCSSLNFETANRCSNCGASL